VLHSKGDSISLVEEVDRTRSNASAGSPDVSVGDEAGSDHERRDSETFRWFATGSLCTSCFRCIFMSL